MYGNGNQLTVYCVSVFPSLITSGVDIFLNCVIIGLFIAANCSQIKCTEVGCEKGRDRCGVEGWFVGFVMLYCLNYVQSE